MASISTENIRRKVTNNDFWMSPHINECECDIVQVLQYKCKTYGKSRERKNRAWMTANNSSVLR
jgi:hypothetical protein